VKKFSKSEYYLNFSIEEITPSKEEVLASIGIEKDTAVPIEIEHLYDESLELFKKLVMGKGLFAPIEKAEFYTILEGEGLNEESIPLEEILDKAEHLALFVVTLGEKISSKIGELIRTGDYPLGYMLDTIASRSAEQATYVAERIFVKEIEKDFLIKNRKALLYSPGYCGWNITAQKKIFKYLDPKKIDVFLTESSLMQPIKSVSGILISGNRDIHKFRMIFPFCKSCQTFSCRERIKQ
jgi:hypothetical protein